MSFNRGNNRNKGGKGCLFLIIGTGLGVVASFLFLPLAGQLASTMVNNTMGGQIGYAMLTAAEPCIMAAILFLFCILAVHYFDGGEKAQTSRPVGQPKISAAAKFFSSKAMSWIITGVLLLCVLASAFVYATTYRAVTTEGVRTTVCLITTKEYEWKQVSSYKVDCDGEKGLSVTLTMRDGKKYEILQSAVSAPRSFHEQYDCKEAFVLDLVTMLEEEYQITRNVSHQSLARSFYEDDEKVWPYVKQIIGYEEMIPEGDEIPETGNTTEGITTVNTEPAPAES